MEEIITAALDTPDGIADCSIEVQETEDGVYYSVTILYPNIVNGFSRSETYCHDMRDGNERGTYYFEEGDKGIHPKIKKLEAPISGIITDSINNKPS